MKWEKLQHCAIFAIKVGATRDTHSCNVPMTEEEVVSDVSPLAISFPECFFILPQESEQKEPQE